MPLALQVDSDGRESGLPMAFVVGGDCAPVAAAHAELKQALLSRRSPASPSRP
jgi:hypothetical protein